MLEKGQQYTTTITGVSHQGLGVGRIEQVVVFVPQALIGETVLVRIDEVKKNLAQATLLEIISPSAQRIVPRCAQSAHCGGCELQHAAYAAQLEAKKQIVQDAMTKLARVDIAVEPVLGMKQPWRYRNKGVFHVAYQAGRVQLGFYQQSTHEVIAAGDCFLFSEPINQLLRFLEEAIQRHSKVFYLQKVMIRESRATGEIMVVFVTKDNHWALTQLVDELQATFSQVVSVYHNINTNPKLMLGRSFKLLAGQETLIDTIGDWRFQISPQSFFQVNNDQAEILYQQVLAMAGLTGTEIVVDAYCGIGTISLFLARRASQVFGVESVSQAIKDAGLNAKLNGIANCRFITAKAEEWLPKWINQGNSPDVVVVDPPRKGCDTQLLYALTTALPPKIIYVSCEPSTLARDVRYLTENGYTVQKVQPVDLFAQTWHIESVCLLERTGEEKNVIRQNVYTDTSPL